MEKNCRQFIAILFAGTIVAINIITCKKNTFSTFYQSIELLIGTNKQINSNNHVAARPHCPNQLAIITCCLFYSVLKSAQNVKLEGERGKRFHVKLIWALSFDIPNISEGYIVRYTPNITFQNIEMYSKKIISRYIASTLVFASVKNPNFTFCADLKTL